MLTNASAPGDTHSSSPPTRPQFTTRLTREQSSEIRQTGIEPQLHNFPTVGHEANPTATNGHNTKSPVSRAQLPSQGVTATDICEHATYLSPPAPGEGLSSRPAGWESQVKAVSKASVAKLPSEPRAPENQVSEERAQALSQTQSASQLCTGTCSLAVLQ